MSDGNWTEDASHENGNYECRCCECGHMFIGHKRRVICKACSTLLTPAPRSEVQTESTKRYEHVPDDARAAIEAGEHSELPPLRDSARLAQAVRDPWANAIDPDARTPGDDLGPSELIRIELRQAMLDCWNSICADTDCHPLDIKHQGKKLFFTPDHWADMVSWELSCRLSHHASMRDLISSGGLPEASPVPSASRGTEA